MQRQVSEVLHRLPCTLLGHFLREHITMQYLCDFDIDEVGNMQGLIRHEEPFSYTGPCGRIKQKLNGCRGVEDDQRPLRSALTALAGLIFTATAVR